MNAAINAIIGEAKIDKIMHAADVFEDFKRYGENLCFECELANEPDLAYLMRLKDKLEGSGYVVTALWVARHPEVHYIDWTIKAVSNGSKWYPLEPYLEHFKITPPKNEKREQCEAS